MMNKLMTVLLALTIGIALLNCEGGGVVTPPDLEDSDPSKPLEIELE